MNSKDIDKIIYNIDQAYSNRFISLDPSGYMLIKVNRDSLELIVEHYSNEIDTQGVALDPETGKPISCSDSKKRLPIKVYSGKSAKEVGIQLTEGKSPCPISRLDHALYIGRELQKAEHCLINKLPYIQD